MFYKNLNASLIKAVALLLNWLVIYQGQIFVGERPWRSSYLINFRSRIQICFWKQKKIANRFSRLEKPVQSQQQRFQTKGIGSFLAFLILMLNRCLFIGFGPVIFIVLFKLSLMSQYKILIPLLLAEQRCTAWKKQLIFHKNFLCIWDRSIHPKAFCKKCFWKNPSKK